MRNEVTIFRTAPWNREQGWSAPRSWFRTAYPFGVGPYNHGVSHIAQGPDGLLYVTSGSRTDGGEAGTAPDYATTGEEPNTACLWRINPADEKPAIEVFARGLRNTFGFCWDSEGRLVGTENGPDAHAPEELNVIEKGRHYGFPFVFADGKAKAYPHTPDIPPGLTSTAPLRNLGPDAGGSLATFDPRSCPAGIVYLELDWPAPLGGTFLTARFGNLLEGDDVGFDVVQLAPDFAAGTTTAKRLAGPLGRPIDLLQTLGPSRTDSLADVSASLLPPRAHRRPAWRRMLGVQESPRPAPRAPSSPPHPAPLTGRAQRHQLPRQGVSLQRLDLPDRLGDRVAGTFSTITTCRSHAVRINREAARRCET